MIASKRTVAENRVRFREKAGQIKDQMHFSAAMALFPKEMQAEIYREILPYLTRPFIFPIPGEPKVK